MKKTHIIISFLIILLTAVVIGVIYFKKMKSPGPGGVMTKREKKLADEMTEKLKQGYEAAVNGEISGLDIANGKISITAEDENGLKIYEVSIDGKTKIEEMSVVSAGVPEYDEDGTETNMVEKLEARKAEDLAIGMSVQAKPREMFKPNETSQIKAVSIIIWPTQ